MPHRTKFDLVVSLGHRCFTASQLRRMMIHGGTMPFDWIISDVGGLTDAVKNKFAGALEKQNLIFKGDRIEDVRYRFDHIHDFPLNPDFLTNYEQVLRRRKQLADRFFEALSSGKHVLFIRHELRASASEANAHNLIDAINRHSRGRAHLLYMSHLVADASREDVTFARTRDTDDLADEEWDRVIGQFHARHPIKNYYPSLVTAMSKWPQSLSRPTAQFLGSARKHIIGVR